MKSSLCDVPIFSGFSKEELDDLLEQSTKVTYRKNVVILQKGDQTDSLYVILSGRVKVYLSNETGKEILLSTHGPGEYFGELALLGDSPRTASVETMEESRLLVISKASFLQFLGEPPEIVLMLIKSLVNRVNVLTENVSSLALLDVYGRVARALLDHAHEENGKTVTERLTQKDIANMVGASREMVSKILKDLKEGGYIRIEDHRIYVQGKLPRHW